MQRKINVIIQKSSETAAANEHSVETAFEIIDVADHLFGMLSDYSYVSLRNCVYENIVQHECSKTELYYQSVFKNNVKEILGDEYEIIKKSSDNKNIPDAWVSYSGEIIPVEIKIHEFDKKALKQLLRYMTKYETKHGIAIGERLTVDLPNNIVFVEMSVIKRFDKNK